MNSIPPTLRPPDLPDFDNPPVVEVALAVQFQPLMEFRSLESGALWDLFRPEFPRGLEQPPLPAAFETFGTRPASQQSLSMEMSPGPMPLRYWFLNNDDTQLIQFQRDRFAHNWRKVAGAGDYPRFEAIRERFAHEFELVRKFLADRRIGEVAPNQCEVTYVNHVSAEGSDSLHGMLADIFTVWRDEPRLGHPEDGGFGIRYVLKSEDGAPLGRLIVQADPGYIDDKAIIRFTLTARGQPKRPCIDDALHFLDFGRERIVRAFALLTTTRMHQQWGRKI